MSRALFAAVLVVSATATACSRDTSGPAIAPATAESARLAIESGNDQAVYLALPLRPLVVTVTTLGGSPVVNRQVTWNLTKGNALIEDCWCTSYSRGLTDMEGHATATLLLNATPGPIEVTVTAQGISEPVVFSAIAVAPPTVLHYNGTTWSVSAADSTNEVRMNSMFASPSPLFAIGDICGQLFATQLVGTTWTAAPKNCPSRATQPDSGGLAGISPSDVFGIVTRRIPTGTPGTVVDTTDIVRFDGQNITRVYRYTDPSNIPGSGVLELSAVAMRSTKELLAVGERGYVVRFDGTTWTTTKTGTSNWLRSVWTDTSGVAAFAVGDAGTIEYYDGASWHLQSYPTVKELRSVWGSSASDVFAVGDDGMILHFDGNSWTPQASGTAQTLNAVWGTSSTSVFAGGDNGTFLRYDGTSWKAETLPFGFSFSKIWGVSASDAFAVGTIQH